MKATAIKLKAPPPEPSGLRAWLSVRYPRGDSAIPWESLIQLHPGLVVEFRKYLESGRTITPVKVSSDTLSAWRRSQKEAAEDIPPSAAPKDRLGNYDELVGTMKEPFKQ